MEENPTQRNSKIEEKEKCSRCGGTLSRYNETGECFRHSVPDSAIPNREIYDRMPSSGDKIQMNPTRGKRIRSKKRDK